MDNGLRYFEFKEGKGAIADTGKIVVVHLIGWLDNNGAKGSKFISTYDRGKPVSFKLGTDRVMKAWSDGVRGMKTGGRRRLLVPSKLGYGEKGVGETVPPPAVISQDSKGNGRGGGVATALLDHDLETVGGEDLEGGPQGGLGQRVGVHAQEQRPVDPLLRAVFAHRLAYGQDMRLVETAAALGGSGAVRAGRTDAR